MPIRKPVTTLNEALQRSGANPISPEAARPIPPGPVLVQATAPEVEAPPPPVAPVYQELAPDPEPVAPKPAKPQREAKPAPARPSLGIYKKPEFTPELFPPLKLPPEPREQVFLSALLPGPNVSMSFDRLLEYYQPHKALQMILRRAMSDYEIMLANGSYVNGPLTYEVPDLPSEHILVQTSRVMPQDLANIAREHFDPYGFESTRAFGYKLATAALAAFFQSE